MATSTKRCVPGPALRIMLGSDACPVVHCVAQPSVRSVAHDDDMLFAATPSDGSRAAQCPEPLIVAALEKPRTFGEQHAQGNSADAWHGSKSLTHNSVVATSCLAIWRESSLTLAMSSQACALWMVASKSFVKRRLRLSQAIVRSTTQRRGCGSKPTAVSDRLTMSIVHYPSLASAWRSFSPA